MKATVYRGIGDKHELIPFEAGKTIAECFDFDLSNAVILKNGLIANKDDILAEGDVLLIRDIPLAPVAIAVAVLASPFVVYGITALVVNIVGLVKDIQKAKQMQADAEKLSKSLKDEVKNIPYLRGAQNQIALGQTQPLILGQHLFTPYLATGTFSKISGATGKDQFFHMVLQAGFAKTVIKELSCDDVVLKKWDTDEPQQGVYNFDSGIFYDDKNKIEVVQDGSPFTTAEFNKVIHTETPNTTIDKADSENYPVGGYVFTLPKNTMAVELCILFRGLICYANDGAKLKRTVKMYPEYKIGNGAWTRFTFDQNGTASNTFSYMSLEQMRFVARKEFSFNEVKDVSEPILVRLLCDTARYEGSARDDVSLLWIQSEKYDKEKSINNFVPEEIVGSTERALSNLVGLKIKVTENNQDKLNKINMVLQSVAKTWNGSTWSVNKEPTRNPASLLLEVLASDTHKASQIKESEIDLDSFGELYEYCEEKGFKFDIVLTEGQTKQEVCEMILENCNAILYKSITGLMTVAIDKPKENAIALFNSQNILSIDNKKNIERKADGIKINYISRAGGFVNSSYLVMRDGQARTADSVLIELNTQGMTEYEHIVKYARKLLASELLQPKQTIIEVGKEGIYYTPLSKVLLQHDSLKVGKGNAEVKSLIVDGQDIVGLKLYEPVEYDENETNGMIIVGAQNGAHVFYSLKYTALKSFTDTVELVEPIPLSASNKPQQGDILSCGLIDGEFAKITTEMLIIGSEPTEDGHKLTLADYNEAVYETGAIPAYEPSFTTRTNFEATKPVLDGTPPPPTMDELQEVHSGINNSIESIVNGTADVGRPDQIENIRATASRDGISFYCDILSDGLKNTFGRIDWEIKASGEQWSIARKLSTTVFTGTYNFDRVRDGYPEKDAVGLWEVRAKAVNGYGFESEFYSAVAVVNADGYGTWIQESPTVFNVQSANRAVNMSWQRPVNNLGKEIYGLKYYEIQISKNGTNWYKPAVNKTGKDSESDWYNGTGQLRNDSANYTQSLPLNGQTLSMPENTTYYFRVRTVGETNTSSWSDTQTGIALATGIGDVVAKAIKTEQLADSAVTNVQIKDGSIVASDKVVANSITTDKLNVLAKNKINNFSITGSLEGWNVSSWNLIDYEGFKALRFKGAVPRLTSNNFEVLPTDIYSFEFGFATPEYLDTEGYYGQHIGLTSGQTFNHYQWNNTTKKWDSLSSTANAYFAQGFHVTELNLMKTYIIGSAVSIDDVPAPSFTSGFEQCRCLQLTGTDTTAHVRISTNRGGNPDNEHIFYMPQIYNVNVGKITARQMVTKDLSSISADIGTITSGNLQSVIKPGEDIPNVFLNLDTEEFRVGNNPSLEDSNHEDAEYLHWKPNLGLFLKLKNLIVDALASTIRGRFRVRGTAATMAQSVLIVNPESTVDPDTNTPANTTVIKTALQCPAGITGNLTGNADTATLATQALAIKPLDNFIILPAVATSVTKIIKIGTVNNTYNGLINIRSTGGHSTEIKMYINGGSALHSGIRLTYGKDVLSNGIKKIIVTSETETWSSLKNIYAEIVAPLNFSSTTTLGIVETNRGIFTPSMTEVSSVEGTVVDSLSLDYERGDISSYQHVFTKSPTAPTPETETNNTQIATTAFVKNQKYEPNRGTGTNSLALGYKAEASGNYSTALGRLSEASEGLSLALGYNVKANGYRSTALGVHSTASGDYSTALGDISEASGTNSIAIGDGAVASGDYSIALGSLSEASKTNAIALGYNATASGDYHRSIGTKFVYLRFASTETEANVYAALSPWLNPTTDYNQGSMGSFGTKEVVRLHRLSPTSIELYDNKDLSSSNIVKTISSGNGTQIGSNLAICTVKY